ncbi:MAG TPA: hypothetical protein VFO60_03575, partial [Candidatus Dormibacteraeota bacterium]|nr:hypothetical protein [Candidatus Dormibacteraeota bacterium]
TLLLFLVGAALVVPSALLACAVALRHLEKWVRASMITIECLVLAIGAIGVFTGYALLFVPVLLSAVTVLVCLALPSSLAAFDDAYDEGGTSWGSSDGWRPGGDRTGSAAAYASEDDVLAPQTGDVTWGELFGSWRRKRRD